MRFPIVEHMRPDPPASMREYGAKVAEQLSREHPEVAEAGEFGKLVCRRLDDGPLLHLDDLSEIARLDPGEDTRFYQDRARLRAGDGDIVASCADPVEGYEEYCRDFLGLGSPRWVRPRPLRNRMRIAEACLEDSHVHRALVARLRGGELSYVHPHMGTFAVWELAKLLSEEADRPLEVIAPPPRLTQWANNKVAFSETVRRLFGSRFLPRTESAWNLAVLAQRVRELSGQADAIGVKLPDAGGGAGNVILRCEALRGKSLREVDQSLRQAVQLLDWRGDRELLVDIWESNVMCSPSVQLWIPPEADQLPAVEGIFIQETEGAGGSFVGAVPARLPGELAQELADRCWLLAKLLKDLGYVGRCSFDLILIGESPQNCRMEFIECNGRWGGTSIPMTLMNRLFGDWETHPFSVQVFHHLRGLERLPFAAVLEEFQQDLYDVRSGKGSLVFYNSGRLQHQAGISAISLGATWEQAAGEIRGDCLERLRKLARRAGLSGSINTD